MTGATESAENFLCAVADRLNLSGDRAAIRATLRRACGGQLAARGPDGRRASTLTDTGTPLEVSVSGGGGQVSPALRYVTETATQTTSFADRLAAQMAAMRELTTELPNSDEGTAAMLESFVTTLYPDTAALPSRFRSPTWLGVVHHDAAPGQVARLKVYGGLNAVPGALVRLRERWPGFADLGLLPKQENLFAPVGAAMEVDARGVMNHKIYLKTRFPDVGVPMRLVRCFGDGAWEVLSEFVRAGFDAATLYRYQFFVCCSQGTGAPSLGITLMPRRRADLSKEASELAVRHHGTSSAVDALAAASESCGAEWTYSGIGLGLSASGNAWKLNVYGAPSWTADRPVDRNRPRSNARWRVRAEASRGTKGLVAQFPQSIEARLVEAINTAGRFLVDNQCPDGYWRDYTLKPGRSESWVTGCVGFALGSTEAVLPPDTGRTVAVARAVAVLRDSQRSHGWGYHRRTGCDADSTAWVVRLLSMGNPHPAIPPEVFARYRTPAGGVRTFMSTRVFGSWADEHDEVAPLAGLALQALGDRVAVAEIRARILRRHRDHGSWLPFWWGSESYATAHNLCFLARTGGIPPAVAAVEREHSAEYGRSIGTGRSQCPRSAFDIAQILIAAVQLGSAETVEHGVEALLTAQLADGGWAPSTELLVPGRWDEAREAFADDRRLLSTAMGVLALLEVVTETRKRGDRLVPIGGNEEQ